VRIVLLAGIMTAGASFAPLHAAPKQSAPAHCGELAIIETHGGTTMRYAFMPPSDPTKGPPIVLGLLAGGGGHVNIDDSGCGRGLSGNFLLRSQELFRAQGFATAVVDAPSDHPGPDGLKGFRIAPAHAEDLGKVIVDLRKRGGQPVWLVGTSRGTISAANAASRLTGEAAPDGLVLTSTIVSGGSGGQRAWAAQTVFDVPLGAIRMPVLMVGHANDQCVRTPASQMGRVMARIKGVRTQVVTVKGGTGGSPVGLAACEGRTPHGFLGLEAEVTAGIARFVRGGTY
jgi:hypothetical protein